MCANRSKNGNRAASKKTSRSKKGLPRGEYQKPKKVAFPRRLLKSLDHLMFCRMKRKAKTKSQKSAFESVIRQIKIVKGLISVVKKAKAPPKKGVTTRNLEYGGYSCGKCGKKTFVKGHICEYLPIPKSLELTVCDALSDEMKKVLNDWHEKKNEVFVAWREKTAEENAWFKFAEENIDWFDTSSSGESISDKSQEESIIGDESSVTRIEPV